MFFCENRIWGVFTNSLDDNPLFLQCNKFLCYKIEKYLDLKYALKFIIFVSDIYELFFGGKNEDFFIFIGCRGGTFGVAVLSGKFLGQNFPKKRQCYC